MQPRLPCIWNTWELRHHTVDMVMDDISQGSVTSRRFFFFFFFWQLHVTLATIFLKRHRAQAVTRRRTWVFERMVCRKLLPRAIYL